MDTNETTIYTAVLISSAVIGLLLLYFAVTMYRSHSRHFNLLRKNFFEEVELLEKERNRIAHDLHDELGPLLVLIKIHLSQLSVADAEDRKRIEKALENIERLTERFGGIAKNLTPRILERKGLEAALVDFIDQYQEASHITMKFFYKIRQKPDHYYALQLYRIVQELIHNAAKHSGATMIEISMAEYRDCIFLLYTDNGTGIAAGKLVESTGLGVTSVKNRIVMMGGKMSFKSNEHGTEYYSEIPINHLHERKYNNRYS